MNLQNGDYLSKNLDKLPPYSSDIRKISWSGYTWNVKSSDNKVWGPGPNYFNGSEESVWVDENNSLHLKIRKFDGKYLCAEIYTEKSLGYGTYKFTMESGFEDLDANTIVGLFTYLNDTQEIDIEFARWGDSNAKNSQYVLQPYSHRGNLYRFDTDTNENEDDSIHSFTWCEEYVKFNSTFVGDSNNVIDEWIYTGADIPKPATEHVHINFWLMGGLAPINELEAEIVIKKFEFITSVCNDKIPNNIGWTIGIIISIGIIGASIIIIFIRKKKDEII